MTDSFQPITTTYRGHKCRSRLEARWLVFFDALQIRYDYEPEGFRLSSGQCYLPDLWLPQVQMWGEVKPNDDDEKVVIASDALAKAVGLAVGSGKPIVIFDGLPRDTNYWSIYPDELDPIGWEWVDVVPCEINGYHLSERRFYSSSGGSELHHDWDFGRIDHPAVLAARGARFERVE